MGTNGILIPPDGYVKGVREICDKHGILFIADEVMAGFGRTGRWFAIDHWGVVPDLMTMAKGITSAYVQLGAVGMRRHIAQIFQDKPFPGGLTYNSHPLACATALATLAVYEEEKLIENAQKMGGIMRERMKEMEARHPSVGTTRSIGLFGIFDLVRTGRSLRAPRPLQRDLRGDGGPRARPSASRASTRSCAGTPSIRTRPSASRRRSSGRGLRIIDRALEITDRAVTG